MFGLPLEAEEEEALMVPSSSDSQAPWYPCSATPPPPPPPSRRRPPPACPRPADGQRLPATSCRSWPRADGQRLHGAQVRLHLAPCIRACASSPQPSSSPTWLILESPSRPTVARSPTATLSRCVAADVIHVRQEHGEDTHEGALQVSGVERHHDMDRRRTDGERREGLKERCG